MSGLNGVAYSDPISDEGERLSILMGGLSMMFGRSSRCQGTFKLLVYTIVTRTANKSVALESDK